MLHQAQWGIENEFSRGRERYQEFQSNKLNLLLLIYERQDHKFYNPLINFIIDKILLGCCKESLS